MVLLSVWRHPRPVATEVSMPGVNEQIIDAITTTNVKVIAEAPAVAVAMTYQAASQAQSVSMQNLVTVQNAMQQVNIAAVSTAVAKIVAMAPGG